jgi:hypothetical protein
MIWKTATIRVTDDFDNGREQEQKDTLQKALQTMSNFR